MLKHIRDLNIPSVAFHLDRWWGLEREDQLRTEPFFSCDRVFTADGGHDDLFSLAGIRHRWSPPAVYHAEAVNSPPRPTIPPIIFVGSWQHYGHDAWWPYRRQLLDTIRARYGRRFMCFPRGRAVRGLDLNRLYASARIVIGDSCLAPRSDGSPISRYCSDRIPETLGRGGFLIHPAVPGVTDSLWQSGVHLATYPLGDFDALISTIDHYLHSPAERETIRAAGAAHTRAHHTYRNRMEAILATVFS